MNQIRIETLVTIAMWKSLKILRKVLKIRFDEILDHSVSLITHKHSMDVWICKYITKTNKQKHFEIQNKKPN